MNFIINVLFYARKSKANQNGLVPIYMRVTIAVNILKPEPRDLST
jgi:hypothetical protein